MNDLLDPYNLCHGVLIGHHPLNVYIFFWVVFLENKRNIIYDIVGILQVLKHINGKQYELVNVFFKICSRTNALFTSCL